MSDTMLFGVLKMPYDMAMQSELSRKQFYQRVQQLVALVEDQRASISFRSACWLHTEFTIKRYLMSNASGRWDGAEKALRHRELCSFYVAAARGFDDVEKVELDGSDFIAVHEATQRLTDHLDEVIGFPIDASPDLDHLAPLFFEHFHAIALHALKVDVAQPQTQPAQRQRLTGGWKLVPGVPTQEMQQAWGEAVVGPHDHPIVAGYRAMLAAAPQATGQESHPKPPTAYESLVRDMTAIAARETPQGLPVAEFAMHALADAALREYDTPTTPTFEEFEKWAEIEGITVWTSESKQCMRPQASAAWAAWQAAPAAQPAPEPVECLDCGSHNIGTPATLDSLIDSVKQTNQDGQHP